MERRRFLVPRCKGSNPFTPTDVDVHTNVLCVQYVYMQIKCKLNANCTHFVCALHPFGAMDAMHKQTYVPQ